MSEDTQQQPFNRETLTQAANWLSIFESVLPQGAWSFSPGFDEIQGVFSNIRVCASVEGKPLIGLTWGEENLSMRIRVYSILPRDLAWIQNKLRSEDAERLIFEGSVADGIKSEPIRTWVCFKLALVISNLKLDLLRSESKIEPEGETLFERLLGASVQVERRYSDGTFERQASYGDDGMLRFSEVIREDFYKDHLDVIQAVNAWSGFDVYSKELLALIAAVNLTHGVPEPLRETYAWREDDQYEISFLDPVDYRQGEA